MKSEFDGRVRYLHQRLNDLPGVVCPEPEGSIFLFPDVSGTYKRLGVSSSVEWALNASATTIQDVRVNHRCPDVPVAEQFLDGSDVVSRS